MANPPAGGKVCRAHGGGAPTAKAAAEKQRREDAARKAAVTLGLPIDSVDPAGLVLQEIAHIAGEVAWYRERVRELQTEQVIWGVRSEIKKNATEFRGTDTTWEAAPHLWVELLGKAQERLLKACEIAHRMGIEERRIQLAEQVGEAIGATIRRVLDQLGLTAEQQEAARTVVPGELRALVAAVDPAARA